jgi:hypothetical protein
LDKSVTAAFDFLLTPTGLVLPTKETLFLDLDIYHPLLKAKFAIIFLTSIISEASASLPDM